MADVKIGVNADGKNVAKAIEEITASVNDLAKAVASSGKVKFKPADVGTAARDIALLNKQFEIAVARSKALRDALKATGQAGKSINEVDFQKLGVNPAAAQRMRDSAFSYAARGTAWDMGPPAPSQPAPPSPRPGRGGGRGGGGTNFAATAANSFGGGVGGGFGQVIQGATRGAAAGSAEGGGMMGGLGGLLKGGGIAAAAFGLFKAGQAVSEGYDMAKERGTNLDTLKRQMGDLGVSFAGLKAMSDIASQGLGVNSKEFVQLAEQYNQASHNAEKTPEGLGGAVRDATQFGRAYGIDPGASAGFFGGMQNMNPKQNNRELALQIAEAVEKGGGRAMAPDVMQFLQTMASSVSRNSLGIANTDAYSAAFGNMLGSGRTGMTTDNVSSMLGQANNAISHMGAAGEAGRNFQIGSYNKTYGQMNLMAAEALAAGGMFATPNSVFGDKNSDLSEYFRRRGGDLSKQWGGKNGNVTSWGSMKPGYESAFDKSDTGNWLRLNAVQRDLGLNSLQQAAAMMNLDDKQAGGLQNLLKRNGVSLKDLNEGGIKTVAAIGEATTYGGLDSIYGDIKKRTGKGKLTPDEINTLDAADGAAKNGGGIEKFQDALVKIMAKKDQQMTEGKQLLAGLKDVETEETKLGDRLIGPLNTMRDALLKMAGGTSRSLHKAAIDAEKADINEGYDSQLKTLGDKVAETRDKKLQARFDWERTLARPKIEEQRAADLAAVDAREKAQQAVDDKMRAAASAAYHASDDADATGDAVTPAIKAAAQGDANGAIGERNNNPFDMRPWKAGQAQAGGYLKYSDMQAGVTAGFKNLLYAQDKHHRNTIADIVKPYAPNDDGNDTSGYIANVSKMTGFGKDENINLHDPKVLKLLGKAMLKQENPNNTVTDAQIDSGVLAATGKSSGGGGGAGSAGGSHDRVDVHLKIDTTGKNAQGGMTTHTLETVIPIARGSGNKATYGGQVPE